MDSKLFARVGAVAFVGLAITLAALQLREERVPAGSEVVNVSEPGSDPLSEVLRRCNAMGEAAARDPICHAAWDEKRHRFLGARREASGPAIDAGEPSTGFADRQSAGDQ